jgi:hypothetical protein
MLLHEVEPCKDKFVEERSASLLHELGVGK